MTAEINNEIYESLGDRWYTAHDDPVALLRAQSKAMAPWVQDKIARAFGENRTVTILDVACGGGFLSNTLARRGHQVTGVDMSEESLRVARLHDDSGKVQYLKADAHSLPFQDGTFDVVTCMDFLEHVEDPAPIVKEASRVLRPGGLFFYHTFNRNFLSWFVAIKLVEWFIPNVPPHLHLLRMFVTPEEMGRYLKISGFKNEEMIGVKPRIRTIGVTGLLFKKRVSPDLEFTFTESLKLSYLGVAQKGF